MMPMMRVPINRRSKLSVFGSDFAAPVGVGDGAEEEADGGQEENEVEHGSRTDGGLMSGWSEKWVLHQ